MAEATTTHGFWELMRIARWHVEGEAYDRALSMLVEAQAALPMAAVWGTGRTASSDGQFFPAGDRGEALNLVKARYGTEPGVKAYSHVSDRFSPFVRLFCVGGPEGSRRGCERHGKSYLTRRRRGEEGDGGGSLTGGAIPSA